MRWWFLTKLLPCSRNAKVLLVFVILFIISLFPFSHSPSQNPFHVYFDPDNPFKKPAMTLKVTSWNVRRWHVNKWTYCGFFLHLMRVGHCTGVTWPLTEKAALRCNIHLVRLSVNWRKKIAGFWNALHWTVYKYCRFECIVSVNKNTFFKHPRQRAFHRGR